MDSLGIEQDARVLAADGEVGRVAYLVADPETAGITGLVAARGAREFLIPIDAVLGVDRGVVRVRGRCATIARRAFSRDEGDGAGGEGVAAAPSPAPPAVRHVGRPPAPPVEAAAIAVPLAEERLTVEKHTAEVGEVRLRKTVVHERQVVPVEVRRETARIEEHAVPARPLRPGEDAFREEVIRVPLHGEAVVVTKETVVTGEVVVDKEQRVERREVVGEVRRVEVAVDEVAPRGEAGPGAEG
jgi:uncharacterized protein (TIGR02271 family)